MCFQRGIRVTLQELNKFEEAVSGGRLGRSVQDGPREYDLCAQNSNVQHSTRAG